MELFTRARRPTSLCFKYSLTKGDGNVAGLYLLSVEIRWLGKEEKEVDGKEDKEEEEMRWKKKRTKRKGGGEMPIFVPGSGLMSSPFSL